MVMGKPFVLAVVVCSPEGVNFWSCKKKVPELLYLRADLSSHENRRAGVKGSVLSDGNDTV